MYVAAFSVGLLSFSSCETLNGLMQAQQGVLSVAEMAKGLKEALVQGVTKGTNVLSAPGGFFRNAAVKILFPPQAQNIADKLRTIGMGNLVDNVTEKINNAAEDAAKGALPIFSNAIQQMSFTDAKNILMGPDNAATEFFKRTTSSALYNAFNPVIKTSINKVGAGDAWNTVVTNYNKIPFVQQMNPRLDDHVTNKAIDGVFYKVAEEEKNIRKNPVARVSALLKKVFAAQDKK